MAYAIQTKQQDIVFIIQIDVLTKKINDTKNLNREG